MPIPDLLTTFATAVRADRAANPRIAGDGTALELLIAPRFRALVEGALPGLGIVPPVVLPEYTRSGIGRPDLAFARPGQPARAFIELKEPGKQLDPRPWRGHDAEGRGHYLAPALVGGLAAAYGAPVAAQDAFDAVLALLSATSYTTRFAFDLEDDFPHVPFPADREAFAEAARIGARIRALEGFAAAPDPTFHSARLVGHASGPALDVPPPQRAFTPGVPAGTVALLPDRSLTMAGVADRVWSFAVSGYPVLYRWLRARNGELLAGRSGAALLRAALDVARRIEELLYRFDQADGVLARALDAPLTRVDLGLPARGEAVVREEDEDAPG